MATRGDLAHRLGQRRLSSRDAARRTWVWILFLTLGFIWGSSYLWIKIGLESLPPLTLIAGRLLLGARSSRLVVALARQTLPREPASTGTCS